MSEQIPDTDRLRPRKKYRDRMGGLITDPATIEARYVAEVLNRLEKKGASKGGPFPWVTVGQVATAVKLPPERVVGIIREFGPAWLIGLVESDKPMAEWGAFQDGE